MEAPTINQNDSIMKRLENFKREDLERFRKDIVLNSLFVSDYQNSFGITPDSACLFFDSFMSFLEDLAEEDGFDIGKGTPEDYERFFAQYDTIDNLEDWHGCYEDFSWVEYEEEFELAIAA